MNRPAAFRATFCLPLVLVLALAACASHSGVRDDAPPPPVGADIEAGPPAVRPPAVRPPAVDASASGTMQTDGVSAAGAATDEPAVQQAAVGVDDATTAVEARATTAAAPL